MKFIILLLGLLLIGSCSHHNNYTRFINSRQSFVKIEMIAYKFPCNESADCPDTFIIGSASASQILVRGKKYVLTAEHVCDTTEVILASLEAGVLINVDIYAIDLEQNRHKLKSLKTNKRFDLCLLDGDSLNIPPIKLSPRRPEIGERVYNFAAPVGIYAYNMVPIIEGFYDGPYKGHAAYTLPAIGGSSGSPIVNKNGHLVGMVHSVHNRFPHFSLSPSHEALVYFLFSN